MTKTPIVKVRAADGCTVTFPLRTIAGGGATNLRLCGAIAPVTEEVAGVVVEVEPGRSADEPIEVVFDDFVRKRVAVGDLILLEVEGKKVGAEKRPNPAAPKPTAVTTTGKE